MALAAVREIEARYHKILVVEDDPNLCEALCDTLRIADHDVIGANSGEQALQKLALHADIAMVISDVNMSGISGHDLLRAVKQRYPYIPVLLITAYASISQSVEAIREGAVDYLVKPFEPEVLIETVKRYIGDDAGDDEPIACAPSSQQLLQLAMRVAQVDSTVLIVGESGTGKEVLARYIHRHSSRVKRPFIAINCAAIPENMLEAMLFGHEKGAYTGAYVSAPGKFEQANGGTLLLDEISEMDMGLQAKLLRVLQEREVERLGGRKTIQLDVRVIATSNRDMYGEVAQGRFREDLYYRLSVLPLQCVPLRDRVDDILPLAQRLLARHACKQRRHGVALDEEAVAALARHPWAGNVRELDNVMQRALILQPQPIISVEDLGLNSQACFSAKPNWQTLATDAACGSKQIDTAPSSVGAIPGLSEKDGVLGNDLKQREFEIIVSTLQQERGSKKNTAERLGISPRTLRYKIARLREQGLDIDAL